MPKENSMPQATRQGLGDPGDLVQMLREPFPGSLQLSTGIWVRLGPGDVSSYLRLHHGATLEAGVTEPKV